MMYEELYQFLIQYKQLPIPGIGTFLLERDPAQVDFPNKKINPPSYTIALYSPALSPSRKFFAWLAHALQTSDRDAVVRFNDFIFEIKKQVGEGNIIHWKGVGTLSKGLAGEIKFVPGVKERVMENPVAAEKVIHSNAGHRIRVGEEEKTSFEMTRILTRILNQPKRKKSFWWIATLAIILLAIFFAIWSFSQHGSMTSSSANHQRIVPHQTDSAYTILP